MALKLKSGIKKAATVEQERKPSGKGAAASVEEAEPVVGTAMLLSEVVTGAK